MNAHEAIKSINKIPPGFLPEIYNDTIDEALEALRKYVAATEGAFDKITTMHIGANDTAEQARDRILAMLERIES